MRRTPIKRTSFRRKSSVRVDLPLDDDLAVTIERVAPRLYRMPAPGVPRFNPQPKHEYVRDDAYRRFVASLPCFVCGRIGRSQAAHSNAESDGKGGSIKASDAALFPLCADDFGEIGCHTRHDQAKDGLTRDQRRAREVEFVARMSTIPRP